MIKLYHCAYARSFRALWMLEEMGLDYDLVNMEFPPRFNYPDYLEINPLGTVPAFFDDNQLMTESSAIVHYLGEKHGPSSLIRQPSDLDYADYLDWVFRSDATLTFPLAIVLRYSIIERDAEKRWPAEDYQKWFFARMRIVNTALEKHNYLMGDEFSAADICAGYAILFAEIIGLKPHMKPAVVEYLDRLKNREAYKRAIQAQTDPAIPSAFDPLIARNCT